MMTNIHWSKMLSSCGSSEYVIVINRCILVICLVAEIALAAIAADAGLISFPVDTEAVVGQTVHFNCSTSEKYYVLWEHTAVGRSMYEYVFFSGRIIMPYHTRHRIEGNSSAGEYHLVISNVQPTDAGLYGCVDLAGHGERKEAQLIVLDSRPTCNSQDEVIGENPCGVSEEKVKTRCMLKYTGNKQPALECGVKENFEVAATLESPTDTLHNDTIYEMTLDVNPMKIKDSALVCRTSSSKISSNEFFAKVLYISNKRSFHNLSQPDLLKCTVETSQLCRYKWLHNSVVVVDGPNIWANKSGSYTCKAECSLRDKQCTAVPLTIQFPDEESLHPTTPGPGEVGMSMLLAILLPIIVVIVVIFMATVIVRVFMYQRCQTKKEKEKAKSRASATESEKGIVNHNSPTLYPPSREDDVRNECLCLSRSESDRSTKPLISGQQKMITDVGLC